MKVTAKKNETFEKLLRRFKKNLQKETFIESYKIKKVYPDKLKLTIIEKVPIATLLNKKKN